MTKTYKHLPSAERRALKMQEASRLSDRLLVAEVERRARVAGTVPCFWAADLSRRFRERLDQDAEVRRLRAVESAARIVVWTHDSTDGNRDEALDDLRTALAAAPPETGETTDASE